MSSCSLLAPAVPTQSISLRPYQAQALDAIAAAEARGQRRQLVALPTGCGKTIIFCELIRPRNAPALVLGEASDLIAARIARFA
jgi:superfamily II DNA or RNA helicase